jgi:hypothetical protein
MTIRDQPGSSAHDDDGALRALCSHTPRYGVSLYVSWETHPGFDELRAVPVRYKTAVRHATRRLEELGVSADRAARAEERLFRVPSDPAAHAPGTHALAVFLDVDDDDGEGPRVFGLPASDESSVSIGRAYRLRPLLGALARNVRYRVLALSADRVALFDGDARGLARITAPDVPKSLEDALGSEVTEEHLQFHEGDASNRLTFHGHGGAKDERSRDLERFHRAVAAPLRSLWHERDVPVVLVADRTHHGRFHELAKLAGLLPEGVNGNPDRLDADELHARAYPLVEERASAREDEAFEHAKAALAHGAATDRLERAAEAAVSGRLARAWIDPHASVAGHIDRATGAIERARGDEDALDELAASVVAHGGDVRLGEREPALLAELRGRTNHQ